jgi:hypothetical protein
VQLGDVGVGTLVRLHARSRKNAHDLGSRLLQQLLEECVVLPLDGGHKTTDRHLEIQRRITCQSPSPQKVSMACRPANKEQADAVMQRVPGVSTEDADVELVKLTLEVSGKPLRRR